MTNAEETDLRVDFARLEGKVDVVITRHDVRIESLEDRSSDHEERIRVIEAIDYVTPKGLWAVAIGAVAAAAGVIQLLNWLDQLIN